MSKQHLSYFSEAIRDAIRTSGRHEDGDIWFLGNGVKAEYNAHKGVLVVIDQGKRVGEVSVRSIMSMRSKEPE